MPSKPFNHPSYSQELAFLQSVGVIDLHVDWIIMNRLFWYNPQKRHGSGVWGQPLIWHADIKRMKEAGYGGAALGIHYFPWSSEKGWYQALSQIAYLDWLASTSPDCLRVRSYADWDKARAEGKLALVPGVEGLHIINGRLERLEDLARHGVNYVTLAHFSGNAACSCSFTKGEKASQGLTGFGREVVAEMNRLGLILDLAHVNRAGVLEAAKLSKTPVFCTHTGLRHFHDHPRNISDEEIDAIAATGGAIGVMFSPFFLKGKFWADSACICDTIEYIAKRVGVRHVTTGTDLDGWMPGIPSDMKDCRDMVKVASGLRARGFTDEDLRGIFRENALRVMTASSAVSKTA